MVGPFLFLLQHSLAGGAVLQGKLADDLAELVNVHLSDRVERMAHEQEKCMEPGSRNSITFYFIFLFYLHLLFWLGSQFCYGNETYRFTLKDFFL